MKWFIIVLEALLFLFLMYVAFFAALEGNWGGLIVYLIFSFFLGRDFYKRIESHKQISIK